MGAVACELRHQAIPQLLRGTRGTPGACGCCAGPGPRSENRLAGASSSTQVSHPIWASQDPVAAARVPSSSTNTMRAARTGAWWSVSCTSCPPGAETNPARCPARNSSGERTSNRYVVRSSPIRTCSADQSRNRTPAVVAASRAPARASIRWCGATRVGACAVAPCTSRCPDSDQPMVPLRRAATGLGTPALIRDWVPRMLRVRPAQLTTTRAFAHRHRGRPRRRPPRPGRNRFGHPQYRPTVRRLHRYRRHRHHLLRHTRLPRHRSRILPRHRHHHPDRSRSHPHDRRPVHRPGTSAPPQPRQRCPR
jgi:hypothetical protein